MIVTVGSTTTSPARSPLTISVVEFPTSPVVTLVTVVSPFCSSCTVEIDPFVVIAAVGSTSTRDLVAVTTLTLVVMPCLTSAGGLTSAIVAS